MYFCFFVVVFVYLCSITSKHHIDLLEKMDRREHIEPVMTSEHTFLLEFKCSYSWDRCISR